MAANAKSKKKVKGKTLNLNTFLGEDHEAPTGFAVVQPRARIDWADAMDNEDLDDRYTLDYKKEDKVVLPTAPKAARGPDVDLAKIPSSPPFTAFLGNLPYDIVDDDIVHFFHNLQVKNVRLPRENGDKGRIRGFGYAEFNNKQDLIEALSMNSETLKNRAIKVSLAGEHDGDRGDRRDAGPDRTLGDWRSDRSSRDEPSRNDSYQPRGGGFSDRDSFRGRSNYDRPFERNGANDFGSRGGDRDYGRDDRYERRNNDRGYGFSDRGMSRGGGRNDSDRRDGRGFREGGGFGGRRDDRDTRYSSERDPPRDSYERPSERPSYDSGNDGNRERRKLQLAPRTKPIEPVPPPSEAVGKSSIFGGAKPVDTAAREREIEERLAKEKDIVLPKDRDSDTRVRKFSSGSGISNRSRRSSDSGPPASLRDEEELVSHPKPPVPRQLERDSQSYNTVPRASRQRCESIDSNGSEKEVFKANPSQNRKENFNNNYPPRSDNSNEVLHNDDNSYSEPAKEGFKSVRHHGHRENSRERALHGATFEEPKPPVYTSANKFSHLLNETEDADRGSTSE